MALRTSALITTVVLATTMGCLAAPGAQARSRAARQNSAVPYLNVKGSCTEAQKFTSGGANDQTYKGCMQDETNARTELAKRWSSFRAKDKHDCVAQGIEPSPSYVEVLTCLEMNTDAIKNAPRVDGKPVPQIGGPIAPGLANGPKT